MRAAVYESYGGADAVHLRDVARPSLADDQVLIRVKAASINRSDWEALTGSPFYVRLSGSGFRKPSRPFLGSDVAGIVEEIGPAVTEFSAGDAVFGDLLWSKSGAFAEFMVGGESAPLVRKPHGLGFEAAASLPQAAGLAYQALTERNPFAAGDHVLVNGGGGGAGTFAIRLAKLMGAEVSAIDTTEKLDAMRQAGADHVIDFTTDDFTRDEHRYRLVIDFAGRRSFLAFRRRLEPGGSYVMVGATMPRLLQLVVLGPLMSRVTDRTTRMLIARPSKDDLRHLAGLVADGRLEPSIDRVFSLEETREALEYFGSNSAKGKVLITVA